MMTGLTPAPCRAIVVLDFDKTLTVRDVAPWHLHNAVDVAFGGAERVAALTTWLQALAGEGALLAIVSRNVRQLVQEAVAKVGWGDLFGPRVYGREDVEWHSMVRTRKSVLIRKLLIEPFGLRGEDVIIVDDDEKACVETEKHIGAASMHVKGRRGLVDDDLQAVRAWMARRASERARALSRSTTSSSVSSSGSKSSAASESHWGEPSTPSPSRLPWAFRGVISTSPRWATTSHHQQTTRTRR